MSLHDEQRDYHRLCREAAAAGIETSLDSPDSPKTVAGLQQALIAARILETDALGKADSRDFVRCGIRVLRMDEEDVRDEAIADAIYEDCGETIQTEDQLAAFIYARLTEQS